MNTLIHKLFNVAGILIIVVIIFSACSRKEFTAISQVPEKMMSANYNHFKGGVLFQNIDEGLEVLWQASFQNNRPYKENAGLLVSSGLLILPNEHNTTQRASLSSLRIKIINDKLYVEYHDALLEIISIIHTHVDPYSLPTPSPRNDYQFGYLGIHNYVISKHEIYDAFKDAEGNEVYTRLGSRSDYKLIKLRLFENTLPVLTQLD